MDKTIQDKYEEAEIHLMQMIDAFQNDIQFRQRYSDFMADAHSTLEYIKSRYKGKINIKGEKFDDWFKSPPRWCDELIHLERARGHSIHVDHIPTGATRQQGHRMDLIIVAEEQAAKERAAKSTRGNEIEPKKEEPKTEPDILPQTTDRWLVNEDTYMIYKKYDNRNLIPILRKRYPIPSGNRIDIIQICTAYLAKIKSIMNTCQLKWP